MTMIKDHTNKTTDAESEQWEKIGESGVDSGLLMIIDPCYIMGEKEYEAMIADRFKGDRFDPTQYKDGVILSTAYGDGIYEVFAKKTEDGAITELKMVLRNPMECLVK